MLDPPKFSSVNQIPRRFKQLPSRKLSRFFRPLEPASIRSRGKVAAEWQQIVDRMAI